MKKGGRMPVFDLGAFAQALGVLALMIVSLIIGIYIGRISMIEHVPPQSRVDFKKMPVKDICKFLLVSIPGDPLYEDALDELFDRSKTKRGDQ